MHSKNMYRLIALALVFASTTLFAEKKRKAPQAADAKWKERKAPKITATKPEAGIAGSTVSILGEHFDKSVSVSFNGKKLKIISQNPKKLVVRLAKDAVSDSFVISKPGFVDLRFDKTFNIIRRAVLKSFSPPRGDENISITLKGEHFLPSDEVYLGTLLMKQTHNQSTMITAKVPKGARSAKVRIKRNKKVIAQSKTRFEVTLPPPEIAEITPLSGSVGSIVTIKGKYFDAKDRIELAGKAVKIKSRSANILTLIIGKHNTGKFTLLGRSGRRANYDKTFTVVRPAQAKSFQPTSGMPGTRITIFGNHFLQGDNVLLGDRKLTIHSVSSNSIVCELPAGVKSGKLSVVRGKRHSKLRKPFQVFYAPIIRSMTPKSGPIGTKVIIEGKHFEKGLSITLAGQKIKPIKKTKTKIWVKIPKTARSGKFTILTNAGSTQTKDTYTIAQYASVQGFTPNALTYGQTLRIQGTRFHRGVEVYLGKTQLEMTRLTNDQIWVKIPTSAKSGTLKIVTHGKALKPKGKITISAPPPLMRFSFAPQKIKRGNEVTLSLDPASTDASVYFAGRPLPQRTLAGGKKLIVTIPSDAKSGYFEVEYKGRKYRAQKKLMVR